jgi:hypothetical protein
MRHMDIWLIVLFAMIAGTLALSRRVHARSWPGRPGWQYQRVLSVGMVGLLYLCAGTFGFDFNYKASEGITRVEGPIWWQIGLGSALLALAVYWARRVPPQGSRHSAAAPPA